MGHCSMSILLLVVRTLLFGVNYKYCILISCQEYCCWQSMRLNDCYATCALGVKYHVINHHISSRSPCRSIMNCFHNLPFVSFRWWRFIYFGYGRTTNKVTITASCSMYILLSGSMRVIYNQTMLATPYIISEMDPNHIRYLKLILNLVWICLWFVGHCVQVALQQACCISCRNMNPK